MRTFGSKKICYFCRRKIEEIDYKDPDLLRRYLTIWSKIKGARETGCCARHQRGLTKALKRARFLALLSYTTR